MDSKIRLSRKWKLVVTISISVLFPNGKLFEMWFTLCEYHQLFFLRHIHRWKLFEIKVNSLNVFMVTLTPDERISNISNITSNKNIWATKDKRYRIFDIAILYATNRTHRLCCTSLKCSIFFFLFFRCSTHFSNFRVGLHFPFAVRR